MSNPILLVADKDNKIYDLPRFLASGQAGVEIDILSPQDLIPLPPGSNLFFLPDRHPIAFNVRTKAFEELKNFRPVAVFVPPGYTQLFTPAYAEDEIAEVLPLFSYAAAAFYKGRCYVAALRIDRRKNHDSGTVDHAELNRRIAIFKNTRNRLIRHLMHCAQTNFCPNAINFFLGKYEAPLPTSPACNARCQGCISYQPKGSLKATQERLTFLPNPEEIAEVALLHIKAARHPVVSFGQGCEGEPLLAAKVIKEAIRLIRQKTASGTIHMNTNASLPSLVDDLCSSGLDSLRVSLNSAQEEFYQQYYSPQGYAFQDVIASIKTAKRRKKFVSLNYLVMPGFTDREDEVKAFTTLVRRTGVDMIQWRNLNYDPQRYFANLTIQSDRRLLGIRAVIQRMKKEFPWLRHGYFNVPKEEWSSSS